MEGLDLSIVDDSFYLFVKNSSKSSMVYEGCRNLFSVWSMSAVDLYIYILGSRSNRSNRVLRVVGVVVCLNLGLQKFHLSLCT